MKIAGIVCEYNPFHNGHRHQINTLRAAGADCIICVMSGNYVQRGEPAILDKYARAEMAVKCGADVVLELPFPYSSLSAEQFARAGVYILDAVGVDTLSFGSECGDIDGLTYAAKIISSEDFAESFSLLQKSSSGSAAAFFDAFEQVSGQKANFKSNDLLGISYIRAINELKLPIKPFVIKRIGGGYTDTAVEGSMPSAMAIRGLVNGGEIERNTLKNIMPIESAEVLASAFEKNTAPVTEASLFPYIQSFFRLHSPDEIKSRATSICGGESILDNGDGIINRICACAMQSETSEEFYKKLFNSRYTDTRIKRVILYSIFGVSDIFRRSLPEYTVLLGASRRGCDYLSSIRKTAKINIVTKPSNAPECVQTLLSQRADSLYTLLMPQTQKSDYFIKKSPFII